MNQTATLAARCGELFAAYPEAAGDITGYGETWLMTLMLEGRRYVDLLLGTADGTQSWSARERGRTRFSLISEENHDPALRDALASGLPLAADGSLFGWQEHGIVSALFMSYSSPSMPEPSWTLCPRSDVPRDSWPPFAGEDLLGPWFWEHVRAGALADLGPVVAGTRDVIFGIPAAPEGQYYFAAGADITSGRGLVLPRGVYAYTGTLAAGVPLPSAADLLADERRVDLGPLFIPAEGGR